MQQEIKLLLFKILKNNGNIAELTEYGYQYSQIFSLIKELITDGFVKKETNQILLTSKGLEEIEKLNQNLGRKGTNQWIEPENKSKISKIEKDFVFLPNQNELHF
jgi:predicted methyltransferase